MEEVEKAPKINLVPPGKGETRVARVKVNGANSCAFTPNQIREVIKLYQNNYSLDKIGSIYGVSYKPIKRVLRTEGIAIRPPIQQVPAITRRRRDIDNEQAKKLYLQGWNTNKIAERFKCRYGTMKNRLIRMGVNVEKRQSGSNAANWRGGIAHRNGYISVYRPQYHRANMGGYVLEHILVWEEYHKTILPEGWVIHHINGIKNDNRPRNLLALPKGKHHSQMVLLDVQKRVRELEIENRQLQKALEESQSIFYISEN